MTDFHIRSDCRLCGGSYTEVLDLGETALANEVWDDPKEKQDTFPLKLVQCDDCGHMQNPVVVDPERLFKHYSYTSGLTESYSEHLREYAKEVWHTFPQEWLCATQRPRLLVVEVGGNDGVMGSAFIGRFPAIEYINVDPSDVPQKSGSRIREFFSLEVAKRIKSEHGPAQVIVANHVFAHVDDLHDMAEGVRELLADDGVFFCEVGHGPTQLNSGCLDVIYHEHLSFYDEFSFSNFWARHGMRVTKMETNAAQGGSIRFQIKKLLLFAKITWAAGITSKFDIPRIKQAAEHLEGLGELLSILYDDQADVEHLGIFGAPAKLTSLLSLMGHQGFDNNARAFDDSPRKQGKFAPGTHLPIVAPDIIEMNKIPFILIASWNFEKEIRARFPAYTGTWIVPLPEVRFYRGGGSENV